MTWCTKCSFIPIRIRVIGIHLKAEKLLPRVQAVLQRKDKENAYVLLYNVKKVYLMIDDLDFVVPQIQYFVEIDTHLKALGRAISYLTFFNEMVESKRFKKEFLEETKIDLANFCKRQEVDFFLSLQPRL